VPAPREAGARLRLSGPPFRADFFAIVDFCLFDAFHTSI
jgi:hypothetical protein